jgi:hypothetical protein
MDSTSTFNVLLMGAGEINFGSIEGPWNHTLRLERKLGKRLRVVGLIDVDVGKAGVVLRNKREKVERNYEDTMVFASIEEAGRVLQGDRTPR